MTDWKKKAFRIQTPPEVIFGYNSIQKLGTITKRLSNSGAILIITDENVKELTPFQKGVNSLESEGFEITIFDKVNPEPSKKTIDLVTETSREVKPEIVIGIGGGSVLDMAKTASLMVDNQGNLDDYLDKNFQNPSRKKILIPTTAGTGSEVSPYIVFTKKHTKKVVTDKIVIADKAIVDPIFTSSLPSEITASTVIDALSHGIEAMMSTDSNPFSDTLALQAIELISKNLKVAYYKEKALDARKSLSLAATLAGYSFANAKVVWGHSFSYALGSMYGLPHGKGCGMALPYIMEYNLPLIENKLSSIARVMGEKVETVSSRNASEKAINAVKNLITDVELPLTISEVGGTKEDIPKLTEEINKYPRPNNPKELTKKAMQKILEKML